MKKPGWIKIVVVMTALAQLPACSLQKQASGDKWKKPFSILGLGDSITEGGPGFFSYLFPLDSMLKRAGYQAKFIGPRRSGLQGDSLHHSGYSGKTAEFIASRADSIYALYPADLVLLHSGHNHFVEEKPIPGIIAAQRNIIQTIRRINPSATICVAAVITAGKLPKYEYIPELNKAIKALVDSFHHPSILFVDQAEGWDWTKLTIDDKVHPNRAGAGTIAMKWFTQINHLSERKK